MHYPARSYKKFSKDFENFVWQNNQGKSLDNKPTRAHRIDNYFWVIVLRTLLAVVVQKCIELQ